jgi:hypothetical protein
MATVDPQPEDFPVFASLIEAYHREKAIHDRCRRVIENYERQQRDAFEERCQRVVEYAHSHGLRLS